MFKNDKVTKPHILILFYCQAAKALDDFSEGIKLIVKVFKKDKVTKPHLLILFYFQAAKALDDFSEGIKVIL